MRISTNYQHLVNTQEISRAIERMFQRSREVSTGVRIHNPSDDPFASAIILGLRSSLVSSEQYRDNIRTVESRLKAAESALGELATMVSELRQIVLAGANGTTDQSVREVQAQQVAKMQERLVSIGNRELVAGQYLFAGKAVTTRPFVVSGSTLLYNGSAQPMQVEIRPGYIVQSSLVGSPIFTDTYNALETIKTDLLAGDVNRLGDDDIRLLDSLSKTVTSLRGELGSLLRQTEATRVQLEGQADELKRLISDYRDVDMAEAIAAYQAAQITYQAALTISANSLRMSLLDFIGR